MADDTLTDFALAAYRDDGRWEVVALPRAAGAHLMSLHAAIRQLPTDGGALGLVSIGDDFCVLVRTAPRGDRVVLSDVTAAGEWPIAHEALEAAEEADELEIPDADIVRPAGDLDIVADLGLDALELAAILGDIDAYPDEMLGRIAKRLGFGPQFDRAVAISTR